MPELPEVETIARQRFETNPEDYGAHYALGLAAYYQKDLDRSTHHFVLALTVGEADGRTERWVVKNLLEHDLYVRRRYEVVASRASQLEPLIRGKRAAILNYKYLAVALFELSRFEDCLQALQSLKERGHNDRAARELRGKAEAGAKSLSD